MAGCADRRLYAFDEAGGLLWRSGCQWGPPTSMALAAVDAADERCVLIGVSDPAIHAWCRVYGPAGTFRRAYQRPDITSWSIPSWLVVLRVADLGLGDAPQVVTGLDTNHRQPIVYRRDGRVAIACTAYVSSWREPALLVARTDGGVAVYR